MKNVKGYKYIYDKNYTKESHDDYIEWAYKRISELDDLLSIRFKDTLDIIKNFDEWLTYPEYIEQLIKEQDYLMTETSDAYDSWMDKIYNL